jgi:hypothetical protein
VVEAAGCMLVIRNRQMEVMQQYAQECFERELAEHVKEFAPRHSASAGNEAVEALVKLGIERSKNYGFTNRGPVRFFIELMCIYGSDFDTDPQLSWAAEVLNDEFIPEQTERADTLHDRMMEYEQEVSGPDKKYYLKALGRMNKARFESYDLDRNFDAEVSGGLRNIYPQKVKQLGDEGVRRVIERGKEIAVDNSIDSARGNALFIALVFLIGHGFAADPFFPWISKELRAEGIEPNQKAENIYAKMRLYLDEVLKS